MKHHIIDAKGKNLGRLASEVAILLQDKNEPTYEPYKEGENKVTIKNIRLVEVSGKKADQKVYRRHSGKPGSMKVEEYKKVFENNPEKVLISAVKGMLPQNRLRDRRLKRLIIEQ